MSAIGFRRASCSGRRRSRILVVDADKEICQMLSQVLSEDRYEVTFADSAGNLDTLLTGYLSFDAVLVDLGQAVEPVLDMLPLLKEHSPETEVICISQPVDVHFWLEAIQRSAYEYLPKPVDRDDLRWVVATAVERHQRTAPSPCLAV